MVIFASLVPKSGISLTSSLTYFLYVVTTLESYANCNQCLARLSAQNKPTLLGRTVGRCWDTTFQSFRFQCSRWHKRWCGWFLLPCLESVQTVVLCRFCLQYSHGLSGECKDSLVARRPVFFCAAVSGIKETLAYTILYAFRGYWMLSCDMWCHVASQHTVNDLINLGW